MSSEQDVMDFDLDYLAMLQAVPLEYEYGMQIYWEPTSNPYPELQDLNVLYTPERLFQQELSADSHSLEFCSQGSEYYSPEMFSASYMHVATGHEAVASINSANRQYTVYSVKTAEPIGTQSGALPEMPNHKRPFKRTTALACVFCRKRKIACGGPVPGDKACKQCLKRKMTCEYPQSSKQRVRLRETKITETASTSEHTATLHP